MIRLFYSFNVYRYGRQMLKKREKVSERRHSSHQWKINPKRSSRKKVTFQFSVVFTVIGRREKKGRALLSPFFSPSLVHFLLARFASLMEMESLLALGYKISNYSSVNSLFIEPDYVSYSKKVRAVH